VLKFSNFKAYLVSCSLNSKHIVNGYFKGFITVEYSWLSKQQKFNPKVVGAFMSSTLTTEDTIKTYVKYCYDINKYC